MKSEAIIEAGICGFQTVVQGDCADGETVRMSLSSSCEKIQGLGEAIKSLGPIDPLEEISSQNESRLMHAARTTLKGCCVGCAVPVGIFKVMQVAAGFALPKDITITLSKRDSA